MSGKFIWKRQYSVGSLEIDDQHKRFFEVINSLYDLLDQDRVSRKELLIHITHLGDYAFYHFATEEGYFKIFEYIDADFHMEQHVFFRKKLKYFIDQAESGGDLRALARESAEFAKLWLTNHILKEDIKYASLFRKKGIK